jgi:hypothetical protein
MQLTTTTILAFAASAMALVIPREEAQPPLPCKNFKDPRFQYYDYGCCSSGAVDCVGGECIPRKRSNPKCDFLVDRISTRTEHIVVIVPGNPETANDFVDTCRGTKARKAYCCGDYKGDDGRPVVECAEVKSTGLLGGVLSSVGGMLGGLTPAGP